MAMSQLLRLFLAHLAVKVHHLAVALKRCCRHHQLLLRARVQNHLRECRVEFALLARIALRFSATAVATGAVVQVSTLGTRFRSPQFSLMAALGSVTRRRVLVVGHKSTGTCPQSLTRRALGLQIHTSRLLLLSAELLELLAMQLLALQELFAELIAELLQVRERRSRSRAIG